MATDHTTHHHTDVVADPTWDVQRLRAIEFPIVEYEVCRSKIVEYADAIGDHNPLHRDVEAATRAGARDVVAPPTFAAVFATTPIRRVMADAALTTRAGFDPARVLHGEQAFTFSTPIMPGDRLIIQAIVGDVQLKGVLAFLTVKTRVDAAGRGRVLDATSTLVLRP